MIGMSAPSRPWCAWAVWIGQVVDVEGVDAHEGDVGGDELFDGVRTEKWIVELEVARGAPVP